MHPIHPIRGVFRRSLVTSLLGLVALTLTHPVPATSLGDAGTADLTPPPPSSPAERRARLQADIAADPARVKEILEENATDWCGMTVRARARNGARLMGAGTCPVEGPADLPANRNACIPAPNAPFKTVRLKFNVFRTDSGGSAAATQSQVDAQVTELNNAYASSRIRFVHTTAFINSSQFRSLSYYVNSEEDAMKRTHADRPEQQHNIYVTNIEPDPERGGSLLGVSTFPWDPSALRAGGGTILDDDYIGAGQLTLAHELGHALGLWHTHHGVLEVDECTACYERADGSNSDTTGDFCSDTPPTPVNYKCQAPGGNDNCSGRTWGPTAPQNYMGYAPDTCYSEFSRQQAGRMHCWIQNALAGWLVNDQQTTVSIAASDATASEAGLDAASFTLTRTGTTTAPLTVQLSRSGTATPGTDFIAPPATATFATGSATAVVRITPVQDSDAEPTETVTLTVGPGAGYQVGTPASASINLLDDDTTSRPVVTLTADDPAAAEQGADPGRFTLTRSGPVTAPLTVTYTVSGTASSPADFTPALSGTIVIPAGNPSASIVVTPVNDTSQEPSETIILTLTPTAAYTPGNPATATVTIADDDAPPSSTLLAEGFDTATPPNLPAGWTSEASGAGLAWQSVAFTGPTPPNIAFVDSVEAAGESRLTSPAFNVPASGARLVFIHGFGLEQGFDGGVLELSIAGAAFTDLLAAGGTFDQGGYTGTISLEDGSPIAGRQAWTGETAANLETIARLPASASGKSVRLRWRLASDGGVKEGGWGLDNVAVTSGGGATTPATVTVTATDPNASEAGAGRGEFTLTRTGPTTATLTVGLNVTGTATPGADYTPLGSTATFAAGAASLTLAVTPADDAISETTETITLTLTAGNGYAIGNPDSATVNLVDNDGGTGAVVFSEAFDSVTAPALPSGWAATQSGAGTPWSTVRFDGLTPPNVVFVTGPDSSSDHALTSPGITVATADARLAFIHGFRLEDGYDGGVLEISVNGSAFSDILATGGSFLAGGYNGRISTEDLSAIAGRQAWTGDSGSNLRTEVRLPAAAAGKPIRLRWRLVTDGGVAEGGWGIDNIQISEQTTGTLPLVSITASDTMAAEYGADAAEFTVSRTGPTADPLTVGLTVTGTASPGADYTPLPSTITIPAGSSTAPLRVIPANDAALEGTETVAVAIAPSPNYTTGTENQAEASLLDNGTTTPVVFAASFDEATVPGLPAGWITQLTGAGQSWVTESGSPLSAPNYVFAAGPGEVSDNTLTSPPIPITTPNAQLIFLHQYRLEPGYDGGVLELALGSDPNAPFRDILAAGGTFASAGYDGPLSLEDGSPIAGRNAWTGDSSGPRAVRVNLPATAAGQSIRLRWRCATDAGVADEGWVIDSVLIAEGTATGTGGNPDLAVSLQGTPSPVIAENRLTYTITVTNRTAVVARGVVVSNSLPANVRLVGATTSQGTVSGTDTVVAQLGVLNSKAGATLTVVVSALSPGTASTSARVATLDTDPDPANNVATLATPILPTTTPTFRFTNATPVTIGVTAGPADTYPSVLQVAGFQGSIGRLAVTLHGLSHTFPDDFDILLVGPAGQRVMLMSDAGGDQRFPLTHASLTFEDDAPDALPDRSAIPSGAFRPTDFETGDAFPSPAPAGPHGTSLASFAGTDPNGTWRLFIIDDEDEDGGRLAAGWSLAITRAAANTTPPRIDTDPVTRIAAAGSTVTFSVAASGTPPLSYQWRLNGTDIAGATSDRLILPFVTPAQSGEYTVRVANDAGVVVSRPALLTVTSQARQVRIGSASATPGSSTPAVIPVRIAAQGDENQIRFSIGFDPERLGFATAVPGSSAAGAGATLSVNANQTEAGRIGIQLTLPAGHTLPPGDDHLVSLHFEPRTTATGTVTLQFVDAPTTREITGPAGQSLPADFLPGTLTLTESPTGPRIQNPAVDDTGRIRFTLTGPPGVNLRIEASSDLRAWSEIALTANPVGTITFTDPSPAGTGPRFYRAVQLP